MNINQLDKTCNICRKACSRTYTLPPQGHRTRSVEYCMSCSKAMKFGLLVWNRVGGWQFTDGRNKYAN